jgi:hypothetical protein
MRPNNRSAWTAGTSGTNGAPAQPSSAICGAPMN